MEYKIKIPNLPISNIKIIKTLKYINNFNDVFSHNTLPSKINKNECGVINYNDDNQSGSHWVAYFNNPKSKYVEFFDSYGVSPSNQIKNFLRTSNKKIIYNTSEIQPVLSLKCGWYCIDYIIGRSKNIDYYDIIYKYNQNPNYFINDIILDKTIKI